MTMTTEQLHLDKEQITKEFLKIIYQGNIETILPFLKQYQQGNISILREILKQAKRYWYDNKDYPNNTDFNPEHRFSDEYYRRPHHLNRMIILSLLGFALLNFSDANTTWRLLNFYLDDIIKQDHFFNILKQIKPKWLTEYLTVQVKDKDFSHLSYAELQILEQHQLIEFNPELIALTISNVRWLAHDCSHATLQQYTTEPIIYQRDIPTLFDYETRLFEQWHGSWENQIFFWHEVFITLIHEKKLDRLFCIQKILAIQSKDWYSHAKAFFKKVFMAMNVTEDELLTVQDSIFLLLHSEYSATVNFAVETVKSLVQHPDFHIEEYLTWLTSIMPRNDVKNAIKMTLQQMDMVLKNNKHHQEDILSLVTDTFLQNDFSLQERAANILVKYLRPEYETVIDKLKMYQENMIGGISSQFKSYLIEQEETIDLPTTAQEYVYHRLQPQYLKQEQKIQLPQNWQELLFFISETLQSDNPLDLDILMSAWLLLKPQFPKDHQKQIKPIIQQMEKNWAGSSHKQFFNMFFVEIYHTPEKAPSPKNSRLSWHIKFLSNYYYLLETFAQFSYETLAVPLLSLPTHAPSYIDPEVLVQRLLEYQQKEIQFNFVDLAIALCRTPRENIDAAIKILPQLQHPQLQQLLYFAFGQLEMSPDLSNHADFKKMSLTEQSAWWGLWDTVIKTHEPQKDSDEYLAYKLIPCCENVWVERDKPPIQIEYKKYISFTLPKYEKKPHTYIYPALCFDSRNHGTGGSHDLAFFQHITPINKTFNDLAYAANGCDSEEILHESMVNFFNIFAKEDYILSPYSLFILASHSFNKNKEDRLAIIETLISCFNQQKINLKVLAQHYATLIDANYAPLARFIECLTQVKNSSDLNNSALLQLIGLILKTVKIPEKLPTNFKKLFELYYELIAQDYTPLDQDTKAILQAWQTQFPTLKSVIQKILKQGV
ncbi:DUF6493 family protein [Acinetobacter sp. VNH17]|uniref:DUF6493 family protein n=1 Tax=Acinetobacter thutiue TaxID=2998078 RepID=A0ABT7WPY8_9GAMM|nr:DUF6493 family protein [Acinetobacter thutiue]MCY6412623.1 DUF6493 family protein [Acinetobacter thutiue]MDN0014730.1 DUF6493 family protein [Acinetobacter thutiue]